MTAARTAATTAMLALTTPWVKPSHLAAAGGRRAAGHGATQRDVEDLLERMREDLDGAAHDAAGEDDVLSMLDRYSSAIREFAALREGDLETAEETDEERVDPAFEALDGHVKEMIEDEERDAATDSRQALVGSLLVIVISSSALLTSHSRRCMRVAGLPATSFSGRPYVKARSACRHSCATRQTSCWSSTRTGPCATRANRWTGCSVTARTTS